MRHVQFRKSLYYKLLCEIMRIDGHYYTHYLDITKALPETLPERYLDMTACLPPKR